MRALAKNPANRYQTAGEFRDDLQRVVAGQQVEATPLLPPGAGATQVISRPPSTALMPPTEPDDGGRRVWLGILIGALILLILGGGAYLLAHSLLSGPAAKVTVPNVVGMSLEDATAALTEKGLKVADPPTTKVDDTVDPGTVLAQDPLPDAQVDEGATVALTIAKSPKTFTVPDLTGKTIDEANTLLEAQSLLLGDQSEAPSDAIAAGHIISQTPVANDEVPKDTPVDVVVSTGPEVTTVTVPDVTCLSYGQAKAQLLASGLQINNAGTAPANPLCSNSNKIASQDPAAGTQVDSGSTVDVFTGENSSPTPEPT
jgi:serine/threonine-protein kinase